MTMDRRNFLLRGLCGLGVLQAGCSSLDRPLSGLLPSVDPQAVSPDAFYYSQAFADYTPRYSASSTSPGLSAEAKGIFEQLRANRTIRAFVPMPDEQQADQAIALLRWTKERYASRTALETDETYDLIEHLLPLLRMFIDVNIASANGKENGGTPFIAPDGSLTIPPGGSATLTQQGYCLDAGLPAPSNGELLSLTPAAALIPQELQPLYRALLRQAGANPASLSNLQRTLWTLRSAGSAYGFAATPTAETLGQMESAMSGGSRIFINYHQKELAKNRVKDELGKLLNLNINGQRINPLDFSDPVKSQEVFQNLLEQTLKTRVSGEVPRDHRNYQMLTPAVAVFSLGADTLKPRISLVNTGPIPFRFDVSQWILQPARKAQRIAMLPAQRSQLGVAQYPRELAQETIQRLKYIKDKIDQATLMEAARFVNGIVLKSVPKVKTLSDFAMRLLGGAPGAKRLVEVIPYVGNALCLYEAASGKNWVTGRDLNAFERSAAAFGTVPGGALLKSVFRERLVNFAQMSLGGAGFLANNDMLLPDDVSAYAKTFTNPLDLPANLIDRRVQDGVVQSLAEMEADPHLSAEQKALMRARVRDPSSFWNR